MLDKILGKKEKENSGPGLRKNEKKTGSDVSGRIKNMVSMAGDKSKNQVNKLNTKVNGDESKKKDPTDKIPRPMPKPRPKETGRARLKAPEQKKPSGSSRGTGGLGGLTGAVPGFGRRSPGGGGRVPDDDRRTLVGAAVFGVLLIVLVGAGYYFLFYAPYQGSLQDAKQTKINEVNTYYKGALATDPQKLTLLARIDSAVTPEQALAVDVLGPATTSWRSYQNQQINTKKDAYGRVMITYSTTGKKDLIMKVAAAQQLVTQADASVLSNTQITTPDTVVIPILITRLQAAGGLINVGDTVDIYLNANVTTTTTPVTNTTNQTNQTNQTTQTTSNVNTGNNSGPQISGSTVLAILRAKDSGSINAGLSTSQSIAINQLNQSSGRTQGMSTDVEELLKAVASGTWDQSTVSANLASYGWKLSDFERVANLGDLDPSLTYMVLLEVPRENALWLIQNQGSVQLTISTQTAPAWMVTELKKIYGSG
jgi:hypothetical protein